MLKQFKVKVNKNEYLVEVDEVVASPALQPSPDIKRTVKKLEKEVKVVLGDSLTKSKHSVSYPPGTKFEVKAPLPGVIADILTKKGKTVKAGEKVFVLEAMKMENALLAPAGGKIESISVSQGDSVLGAQVLLTIVC